MTGHVTWGMRLSGRRCQIIGQHCEGEKQVEQTARPRLYSVNVSSGQGIKNRGVIIWKIESE